MGTDRIGVDQQQHPELVRGEAVPDPGAAAPRASRLEPRRCAGQAAHLAQTAAVGLLRDLEQARSDPLVDLERPRAGVKGLDRTGAPPEPLAPDDRLVGGRAQRVGDRRGLLPEWALRVVAVRAERAGERSHARRPVAGADHRLGDPLPRVEHLEGEAPLVAEPAVVDLGVVARQHPQHPLVADRELDVALARAERADRARILDLPGPGPEAVRVGGERPDGAELDDVPVEGGDVGPLVEGADEALVAALEELKLLVLGDLLAEADAAVTEDAALAVDRDEG